MEIHKINDTTIRCIITQQDLEENEIDLDDFIEHKPRAMSYLQTIIEEAARQEDFHAEGPFTSMQVRVLKDNSICLTLTKGLQPDLLSALRGIAAKLSEINGETDGAAQNGEEVSGTLTGEKEPEAGAGDPALSFGSGASDAVYVFVYDRMSDVINSCRSVPLLAQQETSLYYDREDAAYCLMVRPSGKESGYEKALIAMNEFADYTEMTAAETAYIREHGVCILKENAVQELLSV